MTTNYDLARAVVAKVGGNPNNTAIVKAVAVWLRWESGSNVTGNNAWNIRGVGKCGQHDFGTNRGFATYCTADEGTDATASLLVRRYPGITSAIRAGDGARFFAELFKSPWSAGHYQNAQGNMLSMWRSSVSAELTLNFRGGSPGTPTVPSGQLIASDSGTMLPAWGGIVSFPTGHVITGDDVQTMTQALIKAGFVDEATGYALIRPILATEIGQPWNKSMQDRLQQKFYARAGTMPTDVGGAIGSIGDAVGEAGKVLGVPDVGAALAFFFDPENWQYIGAIMIGVPLTIIGFYLLAGVPTGGRPTAPTP